MDGEHDSAPLDGSGLLNPPSPPAAPGPPGRELPESPPPSSAPPTRRSERWVFLGLVLIAVAWITYVLGGQTIASFTRRTAAPAAARAARLSETAERDRLLDNLQSEGVIVKRTCIGNEAHVNPLRWLALNADAQRTVARALARWCEDQRRGRRMTIIDEQSGRTLAEVHYGEYRTY